MSKPKILLLDLETAPAKAYVWGTNKQYVTIDKIVEQPYTLCWAAKWLGEPKSALMFSSVEIDGVENMVAAMHNLLEQADAVIHYNGANFDMPTLNKDFLLLGINPPSPYKQIDLYREVRRNYRFPSYKLDYVVQALGLGKKVAHAGMALWKECMEGNVKSWKIMEKYNKEDVFLLEKLYHRMLPWIAQHPNMALYLDPARPMCGKCGSHRQQKRGVYHTATMTYQRYQCQKCGSWSRARTNSSTEKAKKNLLVPVR